MRTRLQLQRQTTARARKNRYVVSMATTMAPPPCNDATSSQIVKHSATAAVSLLLVYHETSRGCVRFGSRRLAGWLPCTQRPVDIKCYACQSMHLTAVSCWYETITRRHYTLPPSLIWAIRRVWQICFWFPRIALITRIE